MYEKAWPETTILTMTLTAPGDPGKPLGPIAPGTPTLSPIVYAAAAASPGGPGRPGGPDGPVLPVSCTQKKCLLLIAKLFNTLDVHDFCED